MIKKTLLIVSSLVALPLAANATTVTLGSSPILGPFLQDTGGARTDGILILGTVSEADRAGISMDSTADDINAVFQEFGTNTLTNGLFNGQFDDVSEAADAFNGQQIYIYAFNASTQEAASEFALLTVTDADNPDVGDPWVFPTNLGGVGDGTSIDITALRTGLADGPASVVAGNLQLVPIPEPSSALLAGLAGLAFISRRRR